MNTVAIYCRLSNEDKDKANEMDDSESIQNQKNLLIKYASERGWDIYKIYSDDNYSGMDSSRPDFNLMLKDAESGFFNIILCKHQSRFTRDMEIAEKYLHKKFIEWGIRFVTVVDSVDTSNKQNKKSRQINGLVNEWYCEDTSEAIKAVFRMKQKQGKFIGSFAAYGFAKDSRDRNKITIDEEAAEVVRLIFNLYLQGHGVLNIAKILNEKGIDTPTEYKKRIGLKYKNAAAKDSVSLWNKTTVRRILKNEMYIGNMVQHIYEKETYKSSKISHLKRDEWIIVEGTHESIIDRETFEKVQERLKANFRSDGKGKNFIFAGKLKCMDCGSSMSKTKNSVGKSYLRCRLYSSSAQNPLCTKHSIRLDRLEDIVIDKMRYLLNCFCDADEVGKELFKEQAVEAKIKSSEKELSRINEDIERFSKALNKLYVDMANELITSEQFMELNSFITEERRGLLKKKEQLIGSLNDLKNQGNNFEEYVSLVKKYQSFIELTPLMVNALIDCIEIGEKEPETKEQRIRINWKF